MTGASKGPRVPHLRLGARYGDQTGYGQRLNLLGPAFKFSSSIEKPGGRLFNYNGSPCRECRMGARVRQLQCQETREANIQVNSSVHHGQCCCTNLRCVLLFLHFLPALHLHGACSDVLLRLRKVISTHRPQTGAKDVRVLWRATLNFLRTKAENKHQIIQKSNALQTAGQWLSSGARMTSVRSLRAKLSQSRRTKWVHFCGVCPGFSRLRQYLEQ